jgi:hypothetical protein
MRNSPTTRRIFGGGEPQPTFAQVGALAYARPLNNPADQMVPESLAVGTHRRVIPGPMGNAYPWFSYFIDVISAWRCLLPSPQSSRERRRSDRRPRRSSSASSSLYRSSSLRAAASSGCGDCKTRICA